MAKRYQIEVAYDFSQAETPQAKQARTAAAAERQAQRAAEAQERQAQKVADAQARAATQAANVQARQAQRTADTVAREAQRAAEAQAKSAQQAANAQAKIAQRTADVQAREAQRATDLQARASQKVADDQIRAADRAQARISAMAGRALTDTEVRAKAQGAIHQRLNDKRVDLASKAAEKERWGAMSVNDKFKEIGSTILSSVNPATVAMGAATAVVGVAVSHVMEDWKHVAEQIKEAIKVTNEYRESLPENAALKGHLGDTTTEAKESLTLRSKTLQTRQQATDFESGFLNTGAVSIGTKIDQTEANKLKAGAGRFQSAEGGNATTHGELAGQLPALMKPRQDAAGKDVMFTADEVMAREAKIFDILQLGKSTFSSGASQLMANASLTQTGSFDSIEQQTALQSAFSLYGKDDAGTKTRWLEQATVGNIDRNRKSSIEGSDTAGAYLKSLGVKEGMKGLPIAGMVSRDLTKQEDAAKGAGREFNVLEYLMRRGIANEEQSRALKEYHALDRSGQLQQYMDKAAAPDNAKPIQDKIAGSAADPMMQARSVSISGDLAKFSQNRAHATAEGYRRQILEEAKSQGILAGTYEDIEGDKTTFNQRRLQDLVNHGLQRDAAKAGVKLGPLAGYSPFSSQIAIDQPTQDAIDKIQAAGVDPFAESRQALTNRARRNLSAASAAEAPGRAGLAKAAAEQRAKGIRQAPQAAWAAQAVVRPGGAAGGGFAHPGDFMRAQGVGLSSPVAPENDLVRDMLQQLVAVNQQQAGTMEETNRLLAQMGSKRPAPGSTPTPPPLPIMGPGRISSRP